MGCTCSRVWIGDICAPRNGEIKESSRLGEISIFSPASSDGLNGEARDLLNQLSLTRDSEVGIARLSRVSAQYLPPEGSRTVKVPSGNYELQYSYLSQRGYYPDALDKANQDSFCIHTPFGTSSDDHFFGVFDGHGEFGAQCSQFVKRKLCENLLRNSEFNSNIVQACHASFLATNSQLHADTLDDSMSGTTAITIFIRGRTLYVANTGDSRAVIAERRGKDVKAVDLSIDQTPYRSDELERAKRYGARVLTLDQIEGLKDPDVVCWGTEEGDDGDPPRLWVENGMYPGTAFTRSIGDSIAETIGVVANPEIVVFELTPDHPFFVIASDGVFEFLSSQAVVDMVLKHNDPRDACAAIVAESYRLWLQYETRTDDITVIVVHVNGLTYDASVQSKTAGGNVRVPSAPQVVEVTGSESPSNMSWMSRTQHVRHDLSRAKIRAIESSLENGAIWVPPSPAHRKTWEEEAHIERALHDHFLFRKLTVSQCHVLLDCIHRVEVQAGEVVVEQGGEGDCFYVVGSGEYEVLATQEGTDGEVTRVLQKYTAEKLTSFGELALMYNKPLQASVRAVTDGTLWALKREDFRGVLMSEFANLSSLKLLRSVDLLSRLTILQLSQIAESLSEISFSSGQIITDKDEVLTGLYIIKKGQVRITVDGEALNKPNINSLLTDLRKEDGIQGNKELCVEKNEGSYFGEWTLLGEHFGMLTAIAVDDVECAVLMKEKFDSIVGSLTKLSQDDHKSKPYSLHLSERFLKPIDSSTLGKVKVNLSDVDWKKCVYTTDCCEIGLVSLCDTGKYFTLKRYSKHKIRSLGKEAQIHKEKNLMKSLSFSSGVPQVVSTCADAAYVGILLNTRIVCPIASILYKPINESSARFCAACVVTALEDLHKIGILFRGVSPDVLTFDETGYVQLVDFRFAKNLLGERTFTICGMVDSMSPEIVQGKGHGLSSDWWALGVLIYFMLVGEMPFGSWSGSELETFSKIAKGQITLPETLSHEAVDIITKLLEVDENTRLGRGQGHEASIKGHPWFRGVEWNEIRDGSTRVPHEILSRIMQQLETQSEDRNGAAQVAPPVLACSSTEWPDDDDDDDDDDDAPVWLEDW